LREKQRIQLPEIFVVFPEFVASHPSRFGKFCCAEIEAPFVAWKKATQNYSTKNDEEPT
jgi:hypothetical protein